MGPSNTLAMCAAGHPLAGFSGCNDTVMSFIALTLISVAVSVYAPSHFTKKKVRDLKKWKRSKFGWSSGTLSVLYISILGKIQENPSDNCSCGYCTLDLSYTDRLSVTDKHYTCCTPRCFSSLQPPTRNTPSHMSGFLSLICNQQISEKVNLFIYVSLQKPESIKKPLINWVDSPIVGSDSPHLTVQSSP